MHRALGLARDRAVGATACSMPHLRVRLGEPRLDAVGALVGVRAPSSRLSVAVRTPSCTALRSSSIALVSSAGESESSASSSPSSMSASKPPPPRAPLPPAGRRARRRRRRHVVAAFSMRSLTSRAVYSTWSSRS